MGYYYTYETVYTVASTEVEMGAKNSEKERFYVRYRDKHNTFIQVRVHILYVPHSLSYPKILEININRLVFSMLYYVLHCARIFVRSSTPFSSLLLCFFVKRSCLFLLLLIYCRSHAFPERGGQKNHEKSWRQNRERNTTITRNISQKKRPFFSASKY